MGVVSVTLATPDYKYRRAEVMSDVVTSTLTVITFSYDGFTSFVVVTWLQTATATDQPPALLSAELFYNDIKRCFRLY